jgi:hypothetical protein
VSSAVSRPIAGEQGEKSFEDRLLNQIGKNTFILQLLPPKQPAPSTDKGKTQIQIIKNFTSNTNVQRDIHKYYPTANVHLPPGHPAWFIPAIKQILQTPIPTPKHPSLRFELCREAAVHNMHQIQKSNNSIKD